MRPTIWRGWLLVPVLLPGCAGEPVAPETGARKAVGAFFEAIRNKDWPEAYGLLHPDSKKHLTSSQFTALAQTYRKNLGFEPAQVQVRSCEEHGFEAVAHVIWSGDAASAKKRFKDAIALQRHAEGWCIILPTSFGRKS